MDPVQNDTQRGEVLETTRRTYAEYLESGYADRWSSNSGGMSIAVARRDAWLAAALAPDVEGTIVDLGCGSGALGMLLDAVGHRPARLVGVDILDARLEEARHHVPWGEFWEASADDLGLPDGSVGAVVAMTLLSSITDDWFRRRVAGEVGRVLTPGGRFVVYDFRYPSPRNRHVRPVRAESLAALFPGWSMSVRSLTLLPPIARSVLAAGPRRYRALESVPLLRSHIGAILTKP
jgi:Methylase involved in ubiquinone/menaquinone biosynthesis